MSPVYLLTEQAEVRFPRVSGDEPVPGTKYPIWSTFSPRERG